MINNCLKIALYTTFGISHRKFVLLLCMIVVTSILPLNLLVTSIDLQHPKSLFWPLVCLKCPLWFMFYLNIPVITSDSALASNFIPFQIHCNIVSVIELGLFAQFVLLSWCSWFSSCFKIYYFFYYFKGDTIVLGFYPF